MVAPVAAAPGRGDLVWLTFGPQAGHEQAGRRPAVVLSPAGYNRRVGLALLPESSLGEVLAKLGTLLSA